MRSGWRTLLLRVTMRVGAGSYEMLEERLGGVESWANNRIEACRRIEQKFLENRSIDRHSQPPQAVVEAWAERRALQAVLRILNGEETPTAAEEIELAACRRCGSGTHETRDCPQGTMP